MKSLLIASLVTLTASLTSPAWANKAKKGAEASLHETAQQVTLDELKKIVEMKSATIIDVNGKDVYDQGHIPGAVSFAYNEGKLAQVLPKDKKAPIVAYCGGTMCTAWEFAAKEAMKLGYTNIKHFKPGIKGWKDAGLPVEKGAKKSS